MKTNPDNNLIWHKRYDNIDGTGEIFMGLMLLAFGLLSYLQAILPEHSIWKTNWLASLLFMYGVLALVLGPAYWIRKLIKKHITFPRTGYVALGVGSHHVSGTSPNAKKIAWASFACTAILAGLVAGCLLCLVALAVKHGKLLGAAAILAGFAYVFYLALFALIYAFCVWRIGGGHRWKWLICLVMVLGLLVIGLTCSGNYMDVARPVMLFVGSLWFVSGFITFCSYLRHAKPPEPETE